MLARRNSKLWRRNVSGCIVLKHEGGLRHALVEDAEWAVFETFGVGETEYSYSITERGY